MNKRHGTANRAAIAALAAACLLAAAPAAAAGGWGFSFETGVTFGGYNDVRIPGDEGTLFSFTDDLETDNRPFIRARLAWRGDRNSVILLAAPLRLDAEGKIDRDVRFDDAVFPADAFVTGRYRFDSYRLTWRYEFHRSEHLSIAAGVTGKIRDAAITVSWSGTTAEKTNIGFVPLLHFSLRWLPEGAAGLLVEADALAAPQGRAEDALVALLYRLGQRRFIYAGYRLLEGGADNDEVYNFALVHYAAVGVEIGW